MSCLPQSKELAATCDADTAADSRAVFPYSEIVDFDYPAPLGEAKATPCKGASSRPEHVPRSPGGAQICAVVYRRSSGIARSQKRKKIQAAGGEELANVIKHSCTLGASANPPVGCTCFGYQA